MKKTRAKKQKEPAWLEERDALAIHGRVMAIHGGATGLRDRALLQSALARPRHHHAYAATPDITQMAALYTAGIVRNHPFVDGNKRTGFVLGILFLELHGFKFTASEEDAAQAVFALASGTLDESSYAAWLRAHAKPQRAR